jgi:hypothetical protein
VCATPVEAPEVRCSRCCMVKPHQVAPGRPRGHYPAMPSRHAPGQLVSVSSTSPTLSYLAAPAGHLCHDRLREAHRLGFMMLLTAAC